MRFDRAVAGYLLVAVGSALGASQDPATGLVVAPGWQEVRTHCGACHSLALVRQNRMSRQGWTGTIRWMQDKQGLWELGEDEQVIVEYLARNYGIAKTPWRRKPLGHSGSE